MAMRRITILSLGLAILGWILLSGQMPAQTTGDPIRPIIQAVPITDQTAVRLDFSLSGRYHITDLKNNFFTVELATNDHLAIERVVFPAGVRYADEMVFNGDFSVTVYLKLIRPWPQKTAFTFTVGYQICQEQPVELCYPPESSQVAVTLDPGFGITGTKTEIDANRSFSQKLETLIKKKLAQRSLLVFLFVFIGGFLTSLTPCVYPVIPIIMGYVGSRAGNRKLKGFTLSLFFVIGLALVYSILGVVAAMTGSMIGLSFQNPVVVAVIAAVFIVMGLSLAGVFSITVPARLSARIGRGSKNSVLNAILLGGISAVIAAPCVGPVLIALLSWITQTRDLLLGFLLTFVFSLGMSVIFLAVGTFSGVIAALPKGGRWMEAVKYLFAALLLAGGIYFLSTILAGWLSQILWGMLLIGASVWMGLFKPLVEANAKAKLLKTVTLLVFLAGAGLFLSGLISRISLPPQIDRGRDASRGETLSWLPDLNQAKASARQENRFLMVDGYADWCVACKELDEKTFADAAVVARLKQFILARLDFTAKSAANREKQKLLGIIGLPTVIFFDPSGKEVTRFSGFLPPAEFLEIVNELK